MSDVPKPISDALQPIKEIQDHLGDQTVKLSAAERKVRFEQVKANFAAKYKESPQKAAAVSKRLDAYAQILEENINAKHADLEDKTKSSFEELKMEIEMVDKDRPENFKKAWAWADAATDADRKTEQVGTSTIGIIDDYEGVTNGDNGTEAHQKLRAYVAAVRYENLGDAEEVMKKAVQAFKEDEDGSFWPGTRLNDEPVDRITSFGKYEGQLRDFKLSLNEKAYLTGLLDMGFSRLKGEQRYQYQEYLTDTLQKLTMDSSHKLNANRPLEGDLLQRIKSPSEWADDVAKNKPAEQPPTAPVGVPAAVGNGAPAVAAMPANVPPAPTEAPAVQPDLGPLPPPIATEKPAETPGANAVLSPKLNEVLKDFDAETKKVFDEAKEIMKKPDWEVGAVYNVFFKAITDQTKLQLTSDAEGKTITIDPEGSQKYTLLIKEPQSKADVVKIVEALEKTGHSLSAGDMKMFAENLPALLGSFGAEASLQDASGQTPTVAPKNSPAAKATTESAPEQQLPISDVYSDAWRTEGRPGRTLHFPQSQYGGKDFRAAQGVLNLRDTQDGKVVKQLKDNYVQLVPSQNMTLEVKGKDFVLVQYADRIYYVPEGDLQLVEKTPTAKPEKPWTGEHFEAKGPYADQMNRILRQIEQEHEKPAGVNFKLPFNGGEIPTCLRKVNNSWQVSWGLNNEWVLNYNTLSDAQKALTEGWVQYSMMWPMLNNKANFVAAEKMIGKVEDFEYLLNEKRKFNEVQMELDWKDSSIFGGGNAKLFVTPSTWGVITFRIERDHVGQNGEDSIEGISQNFPAFISAVAEMKAHAEKLDE